MKKKLNVGFITTVSGRWPRELPNERLKAYGDWLTDNLGDVNLIKFDNLIDSPDRIEEAISTLKKESVDIVIMLYGAFTGDDVCTGIAENLNVPIVLWATHEPPLNNGRLLANAVVALTMNSASLHRLGHLSYPIYGDKEEVEIQDKIKAIIGAYAARKAMSGAVIGLFGYRPTAFYNSAFDEGLIRRVFGIRMESTDLKVVFDRIEEIQGAELDADQLFIQKEFTFDKTNNPEHYLTHSKLYLALKQIVAEQGYDYSTIKCWPEMGALHTTPCAVLGRLADDGVHISCESDIDATLALIAQNCITNKPNFITDMIDINEKESYMTFWHCGNAAPSLHDPKVPAVMGDHPLAGQGTAFHGPLKQGKVTASRFCNIRGEYKLLVIRGEAIPTDMYTPGSMVNVKTKTPAKDIMYGIIENGVPHHYSIVWEDIADTLIMLANIMGIEVIEY